MLRADTLGELFDLAALLERQPLPGGRRVAIVTNAGGPGILAADACQAAGLELPPLPQELRERLAAIVPRSAGLANPVDLLVDASPEAFAAAVEAIGRSDAVDAIIAVFVARPFARAEDVARALRRAAGALDGRLPLLSVFMTGDSIAGAVGVGVGTDVGGGGADGRDAGGRGADGRDAGSRGSGRPWRRGADDRDGRDAGARGADRADERSADAGGSLPVFRYPEDAARALARAADHARWRRTPHGRVPELADTRGDEASAIVAHALAAQREGGWLDALQTYDLLACYGLPLPAQRVVRSPTAAARAASELGGRVALKALAPGVLHKSRRRRGAAGPVGPDRGAPRGAGDAGAVRADGRRGRGGRGRGGRERSGREIGGRIARRLARAGDGAGGGRAAGRVDDRSAVRAGRRVRRSAGGRSSC